MKIQVLSQPQASTGARVDEKAWLSQMRWLVPPVVRQASLGAAEGFGLGAVARPRPDAGGCLNQTGHQRRALPQ